LGYDVVFCVISYWYFREVCCFHHTVLDYPDGGSMEEVSSLRPTVKVRVKIKLSLYRFGQALRAPRG